MGLYGNIIVEPVDATYWPPVNREVAITLDDVLIEEGRIAPFRVDHPTFTAMGRFGNVFLVNGGPAVSLHARRDEVVRFYLTNTANTRVFNVGFSGARVKLVGGDSGHCEHETLVDHVIVAPSERVVVDVLFHTPGSVRVEHVTPAGWFELGIVEVAQEPVTPSFATQFELLRTNADMVEVRARIEPYLSAEPDKVLALVAEMDMGEARSDSAAAYVCPMHPEVTSREPSKCPWCGMKLVPAHLAQSAVQGDHHHGHEHDHGHHSDDKARSAPAGIEWEDDMVAVNRLTTPANMRWKLIDRGTAAEGRSIDWRFRVGDRVKIRLVNEMESDHPMHHPFHIHGAGRFLVASRDGAVESNLVWKDTVLVATGQTVDLLLDITNPGVWMAHCHIAEHHESGMMFSFRVDP
nr:hypothetical protein [uncultured bacterium]